MHFLLAALLVINLATAAKLRREDSYEIRVHTKDQVNYTTNNIEDVRDPLHAGMIALENGTIYTAADAAAIDYNSMKYYLCQTGFDFREVTPDPVTGTRVLSIPNGTVAFLNYKAGSLGNYRWALGSSNPEVFKNQDWRIVEVGNLLSFSTGGRFPAGVLSNTTFKAGSLFAYTQYTYIREIKNNKKRKLRDIDLVRVVSREPTYSIANEIGSSDQLIPIHLISSEGVNGWATVGVVPINRPENSPNSTVIQINRAVLTFDKTLQYPPLCPVPFVGERWKGLQN